MAPLRHSFLPPKITLLYEFMQNEFSLVFSSFTTLIMSMLQVLVFIAQGIPQATTSLSPGFLETKLLESEKCIKQHNFVPQLPFYFPRLHMHNYAY